jgi:uncharacterized caspase-like protein
MKCRVALALLAGALGQTGRAQEGCPVSRDLVVRALELVSTHARRDDLVNGLMLLKQAQLACDENGDAYYYRALFERQLGQGNPQNQLAKAADRNSPALKNGEDPFHLATPARGVAVAEHSGQSAPTAPHIARDLRKPGVSEKWALVVGIARFRQPRLNLRYTRKDADAMAALLKDPIYGQFRPDHVQVIEDEEATTVNVRAGINWLARSAKEDDLAVIYIASHGTAREDDVAGVNYIVTHDTDMETRDGLYSTAIPMVDISHAVRTRLKAFRVVVILDTCHSAGAVTQTVEVPQSLSAQMLDQIREGTGRVILAASQTEEFSYEDERYGHGLFTYHLLAALKEHREAPIDKIYQMVEERVAQDATAKHWKQHPVLSASDEQSVIVLGTPPLGPAAWLESPRSFFFEALAAAR